MTTENHNAQLVGERLKAVRQALSMSQKAFGDLLGLGQANLSKTEKGKLKVGLEHLTTLHQQCNVRPTYIMTGEQPMFWPEQAPLTPQHLSAQLERVAALDLPQWLQQYVRQLTHALLEAQAGAPPPPPAA